MKTRGLRWEPYQMLRTFWNKGNFSLQRSSFLGDFVLPTARSHEKSESAVNFYIEFTYWKSTSGLWMVSCMADLQPPPYSEYISQWHTLNERTLKMHFFFLIILFFGNFIGILFSRHTQPCYPIWFLSCSHYLPSTEHLPWPYLFALLSAIFLFCDPLILARFSLCGHGREATHQISGNSPMTSSLKMTPSYLAVISHQWLFTEGLGPMSPPGICGWTIDRSDCVQALGRHLRLWKFVNVMAVSMPRRQCSIALLPSPSS